LTAELASSEKDSFMIDASFSGQVVVVTGASRGIGRATALAFAEAGARVVVNYFAHEDEALEVVKTITNAGGAAIAHQADVASLEAVEGLIQCAVDTYGRLDVAISNAVYSDREPFYEANMNGFRRTIDVTMWGAFHLVRSAARQLIRQQQGGVIGVVSSPHAFIPIPRAMAYNMAKAAIDHMCRTAAIELAGQRIRVNCIHPGWTDTPGERKFFSEQTLQEAAASIPWGRLGTAEEIARGILFLCDPRNDYVTGATLLMDGGITLPWWANQGSGGPIKNS
jgi:glucose 1-dehydrogenase